MTEAEVAAYLAEQRVLNVATIGPTGHPHVVAMWFAIVDGTPAFWTFAKSQKVVVTCDATCGSPPWSRAARRTPSCAASSYRHGSAGRGFRRGARHRSSGRFRYQGDVRRWDTGAVSWRLRLASGWPS